MEKHKFIMSTKTVYTALVLLFFTINLYAQEKSVSGKIVDSQHEALIGASVMEKGTKNGTISDIDGKFSLKVSNPNAIVVISYIGYQAQDVKLKGKSEVTVILHEDATALEGIAVIGYGTMRKKDLTGSLTQVKASDFENQAVSSLQSMMKSTVPGLSVGFSGGAKPGGSLVIRGENSPSSSTNPLIVLDGIIYPGDLTDINPNDIEQMDVLKDASSAAIYGARASNGVIIITTKIGKSEKPTIKADVTLGVSSLQKRQRVYDPQGFTSWRTDVMNSINVKHKPYEFNDPRTLPSDISLDDWMSYGNGKGDPVEVWLDRIGFSGIEKANYLAGRSVDWEDMVFQTGFKQDYNMSLSGKSDKVNYYWSIGYTDYDGLSTNSNFNTVRTRLNLDAKVTKFLTVGLNTHFAVRDESAIGADWGQFQKLTPYGTAYNEDGTYKLNPTDDRESKHPLIDSYYTTKDYKINSLNSNLYAKVTLPFNITYQLNYSPRFEWVRDYQHQSSKHPDWSNIGGSAYRNQRTDFMWQLDNIVKWKQTFNKDHEFDVTLLMNAEKIQKWSDKMSNNNFGPSDILGYHNISSGINPNISSSDEYRTGDALMARVFYSYKQRYLTTLTIRRDGYSAFGQDNPRANFPTAGFGWVASEESFMNNIKWIDFAKLRASWGVTGNRDVPNLASFALMNDGMYQNILPSGTLANITYIYTHTMENKKLKWEEVTGLNFGLDFGVLNNRLTGNIDLYKKNSKDFLLRKSLPSVTGYNEVWANLGEIENKGIELSITSTNMKSKNFEWKTTFNYALNKNKILDLYNETVDVLDETGNIIGQKPADDTGNGWFVGQALDVVWGQRVIGVWQVDEAEEAAKYGVLPGDFKVKDVNGDYAYDDADREYLGKTTPKYSWTLRNDFKINKCIDVSFMLYSQWGHIGKFNIAKHNSGYQNRYNGYVLPYWTEENPTNDWHVSTRVMVNQVLMYGAKGHLFG